MKMNKIADIWNSINGSGLLIILVMYLWRQVKPLIDNKMDHADNVQAKQMWELLEVVADTAVNAAISKPVDGSTKFAMATRHVLEEMSKNGYDLDSGTAGLAVQSAYETMNVNPGKEKQPDGKTVAIDTTKEA